MPARIEHALAHLIAIGTDPGIGLAALHQADGAGIGHALDHQFDAFGLEYLTQDIPGQTTAVGMAITLPDLAGQANFPRRSRLGIGT
ncbi:hypothetical protein D3C71_1903060 [compost metagenome]